MKSSLFVSELKENKKNIHVNNSTFTDNVEISSEILSKSVIIENCVFEDDVLFTGVNLNCGIRFVKCTFLKAVKIIKCYAKEYDYEFNINGFNIEFNESVVNGLFFEGENLFERGVSINNKSIINNIYINTVEISEGSFAINDSIINEAFVIKHANVKNEISVRNNCNINADVRFENVKAGSLSFTYSNFKKSVKLWSGYIGLLTFNGGVFDANVSIRAVPVLSYMTIIDTEFKKTIIFDFEDSIITDKRASVIEGSINKVFVKSGKFWEQFIINGGNRQIDELTIATSKQLVGDLYFNYCRVLAAKISGSNYNSNIVFNHSSFNKIGFDFFYNYSTLSFNSLAAYNKNSEIAINHSIMGKAHFFNAFFNTFDKVIIYNSVLTEIIAANVQWFDDNALNPDLHCSSIEHTYKKEIYRQIKYALEKQGDRITSLRFKSMEMDAFKKEVFSRTSSLVKVLHNDRFILWLGLSNNYGQNWIKPIFLAIGFTVFFYSLIVVGISEHLTYSFNLSTESLLLTWGELLHYTFLIPQLMNPATNISKSLPENLSIGFIVYLWDYFLKILLAFFIFQIISAFRKYMK